MRAHPGVLLGGTPYYMWRESLQESGSLNAVLPSSPASHLLFRDVSSPCLPWGSRSASGEGLTLLVWFPHSGRSPFPWAICSAHGAMRLREVLASILHIYTYIYCTLFIKVVFFLYLFIPSWAFFAFSLFFLASWGWRNTPKGTLLIYYCFYNSKPALARGRCPVNITE